MSNRITGKKVLVCSLWLFAFLPALGARPSPVGSEADQGSSLTLVLAGDVMLGRGVAQALDGDWEAAFAQVSPWLAKGGPSGQLPVLRLVNLESPLTNAPQVRQGYDLRAPPAAVAALHKAGIDAVSLANNHALDAGPEGMRETVDVLSAAGIAAWTEKATIVHRATSGPLGRTPSPVCAGLAFDDSARPLDLSAAAEAVSEAARRADIVIVSIHWGGEYQAAPSTRQQAIARALAEAGADVIAGHGPHVLQRVEWVDQTLVAYSLGNFLFDQPYPEDCRWGAILRVTLCGGRVPRRGDGPAVEIVPTVVESGRVRLADEAARAAILERLGAR